MSPSICIGSFFQIGPCTSVIEDEGHCGRHLLITSSFDHNTSIKIIFSCQIFQKFCSGLQHTYVRGVVNKFVASHRSSTATQLKPTLFFYIISIFKNALGPVVLEALYWQKIDVDWQYPKSALWTVLYLVGSWYLVQHKIFSNFKSGAIHQVFCLYYGPCEISLYIGTA